MPKVAVIKLPDDPICARASIGGSQQIGFYCTYRGDVRQVIDAVETILAELKRIAETGEPPVDPG